MQLIDTHCHIHSADYPLDIAEVDQHCREAGVTQMICVGTDADDSRRAVEFVMNRPNSWASVGQHPHEAKYGTEPLKAIRGLVEAESSTRLETGDSSRGSARFFDVLIEKEGADEEAGPAAEDLRKPALPTSLLKDTASLVSPSAPSSSSLAAGEAGAAPRRATPGWRSEVTARQGKIVAIGECGLDYFYGHSSKEDQERALRYQIELALEYDLPMIFHVRDAFDDFWPIFDSYTGVRGELHSFTDTTQNLDKALTRGLFIGVNGIMTFTGNDWQLEVARRIPLDRLLLETDAPFLTPRPLRGKVNEPARVLLVAEFLSDLRQEPIDELAHHTVLNARRLFSL